MPNHDSHKITYFHIANRYLNATANPKGSELFDLRLGVQMDSNLRLK